MENNDKIQDLETKLKRTVSAAYHALLEMSAWMGIPEKKRLKQIDYFMKNVQYCADHDLREHDKWQMINRLAPINKVAFLYKELYPEYTSEEIWKVMSTEQDYLFNKTPVEVCLNDPKPLVDWLEQRLGKKPGAGI